MIIELLLVASTGLSCTQNNELLSNTTTNSKVNINLTSDVLNSDSTYDLQLLFFDSITDIEYSSNNVNVISDFSDDNFKTINLKLQQIDVEKVGRLTFDVVYSNNETKTGDIYTFISFNRIYISSSSVDDPVFQAINYNLENDLMNSEEVNDFYNSAIDFDIDLSHTYKTNTDFVSDHQGAYMPWFNSQKTYLAGTLKFEYTDGTIIPLRNIKFEVCAVDENDMDNIIFTVTGYTDNEGAYRVELNQENDKQYYFIKVYSATTRTYVTNIIQNVAKLIFLDFDYYMSTEPFFVFKHVIHAPTGLIKCTNNAIYSYRAIFISQILEYGYDLIIDYDNKDKLSFGLFGSGILNVLFPLDKILPFDINMCSFCINAIMGIMYNDWDNIFTLLHELGHFIEARYDIYSYDYLDEIKGSIGKDIKNLFSYIWNIFNDEVVSDFEWGALFEMFTHSEGDDLIYKKVTKQFGMNLAWSEAWASVFAMIVHNEYNIKVGKLEKFEDHFKYIDDNTANDMDNYCEAQEKALISYLYNLYDYDNDSVDQIGLGVTKFIQTTTKDSPKCFSDFIKSFNEQYPKYYSESGSLLENYRIAPKIEFIRYDINGGITIGWIANGSVSTPLNSFELNFYTMDDELVYTSARFNKSGNELGNKKIHVYYISSVGINEFVEKVGSRRCKVEIVGYNSTKSPESGPYNSKRKEFILDSKYLEIFPSQFNFDTEYVSKRESGSVSVSTNEGLRSVAYVRLRCNYNPDSDTINLSARRQGAGEAYLTMYFLYLVTSIEIDISFWKENEYLTTADASAYIQYMNSNGNWINAFDLLRDIDLSEDRNNPDKILVNFPTSTQGVRIYSSSKQIGNLNKGRLSISLIRVYR